MDEPVRGEGRELRILFSETRLDIWCPRASISTLVLVDVFIANY